MLQRMVLAGALLLVFLAQTVRVLTGLGFVGFFESVNLNEATRLMFLDLVIALALIAVWMVHDAKTRGRRVWPYLVVTLTLGSAGPLAYLIVRSLSTSGPVPAGGPRAPSARTESHPPAATAAMCPASAQLTLRDLYPLVGFVVPTLITGYGVLLPRHGLSGINEITVGFGSTVFGACLMYVVGLRAARRSANVRTSDQHRSHGWRRPVPLARHAARPVGILGRLLAHVMAKETAAANAVTMTLAEIGGGDHVLDVGCGPGAAVATIARRLTTGRIVGLDPSGTMIGLATRANRAAIAHGTAVIEQGDAARLPHAASSFDRILSTHTMYFWADLARVAQELRRVLKPGGRLVLGFGAPEHMRHNFPSSVYSLRSVDEVRQALRRAGFDDIRVETRRLGHRPMHWMIAT